MRPSPALDITFYERHFIQLAAIAIAELHLSEDEAITLAHDVLLSSMRAINTASDIDTWLYGALTIAAHRLAEVRT